jgi:hypothetical protein
MDRFEQATIVTELIDRMRSAGSWSGETHIQKGTYLLQELTQVPLGFQFILYKHGPFSFDLRDALVTMRADQLIDIDVQPYPYGPRLVSTDTGRAFGTQFEQLLRRFRPRLDLIAKHLRDSRVDDLERYATAFYVSRQTQKSEREWTTEITRLKPHISVPEAAEAIKFIDDLSKEAESLLSGRAQG